MITVGSIQLKEILISPIQNALVHYAERWVTLCGKDPKWTHTIRGRADEAVLYDQPHRYCTPCKRELRKLEKAAA